MTAPPKKRHALTCSHKRRWPDQLSARAGAMRAIELHGDVARLWIYRCPECRGWHLTKRDNGREMLVTVSTPLQFGMRGAVA